MLCPNCGVEVGATLTLCSACEAQRAAHVPPAYDAAMPLPAPGAGHVHEDRLSQILNYFSTPLGMLLGAVVLFLSLVVFTMLFFPNKGIAESSILSVIFCGIGCAAAGPYMFAFDSSAIRKIVIRIVGVVITAVGLFLYSAYSGRGLAEVYALFEQLLVDRRAARRTSSAYYR